VFNLLVKGTGWAESNDTMFGGRIFEYTEQHLIEKFKPGGQLDLTALTSLPTLFMEETYGKGDQVARIGSIIRARISGRDIALEYYYDPSVPALTNIALQGFSAELDIEDFEFARTHWAIKDVDLFRVLFRNMQPRRQQPKVFHISDPENIEPSLVSAMMPFHPYFDIVYNTLQKTAEEAGLRCRRADDIWENPAVIQDVVSLIDRSKMVICDCTNRNPNVFYEIGIAHTLGREVILITQADSDIPFDLRHLRYVHYLNNSEGLRDLSARLLPRLTDLS
jgi:hypothetical protein